MQLFQQVKEGNEQACKRLIDINMSTAVRIGLQRSEKFDIEIGESISNALCGLCETINCFKLFDISSLGFIWLVAQRYMAEYEFQSFPGVPYRFPDYIRQEYYKCYSALKNMGCLHCENFPYCETAKASIRDVVGKRNESVIDAITALLSPVIYLEDVENEILSRHEENIDCKADALDFFYSTEVEPIDYSESAYQEFYNKHMREMLEKALNKIFGNGLSEINKDVFRDRFGIGRPLMSIEQVAEKYGLTPSQVRGITYTTLKKLRRLPTVKLLFYLYN